MKNLKKHPNEILNASSTCSFYIAERIFRIADFGKCYVTLAYGPAGIDATPCCRLRHGFVSERRLTAEAHAALRKPQADKTGKA